MSASAAKRDWRLDPVPSRSLLHDADHIVRQDPRAALRRSWSRRLLSNHRQEFVQSSTPWSRRMDSSAEWPASWTLDGLRSECPSWSPGPREDARKDSRAARLARNLA